jgi:hypothetical protein
LAFDAEAADDEEATGVLFLDGLVDAGGDVEVAQVGSAESAGGGFQTGQLDAAQLGSGGGIEARDVDDKNPRWHSFPIASNSRL